MKTGTKETTELLLAIKAIAIRTAVNLHNDGKVSAVEVIGYAQDFRVIGAAFTGVAAIPGELLDLDSEEMAALKVMIIEGLKEVGFHDRTSDIADWTLDLIYAAAQYALKVKSLPPRAIKVDIADAAQGL